MDMPQNQDFKYVLQDFGNIYIGARYSYEEMLKSAVFEGHLTTEKIVEIAKNILEHSETDIELGSLCAEINRAAYTFFIEEENRRKGNTMNKNLTNIKTEYFLIVNGVKQLFCFETKEEAINYARPHLNNETKIEVLTVKTEIIVEKTQETIE